MLVERPPSQEEYIDGLQMYFFEFQQAQEDDEEAGTCGESESESVGDVDTKSATNLQDGIYPPAIQSVPGAIVTEEAENPSRVPAAQSGNQNYLWLAVTALLFALIVSTVISVSICVGTDQCHGSFYD